jgi:hypothetical protein
MSSARSQRGLGAAALIITLIVVGVVLVLGRRFLDAQVGLDQQGTTSANLVRISDSLVQYASLNQRLPCPAPGTAADGAEAVTTTTNPLDTCTSADGVVPWSTLGLRREHALDGWGRKISYRVFSGPSGFTQSGGVNMTNCNSSLGAPIDPVLGTGSSCKTGAPPPNSPAQFLAARGNMLAVVDESGTTRNGNAFVLISHGESGYGAFLAEAASGRTILPASGGPELANTQASGPFQVRPRSDPSVSPSLAAHFDDKVAYLGASELATRAKLAARSWSQYPLSATFNLANVTAAAPGLSGQNTNQASLAMGGFLVTARSSSGTSNVGVRTEDGVTGIGAIGGGSGAGDLNSTFNERLAFQLGDGSEFGKADVALNAFEITDYSPLQKERAEISFWRAGEPLQTSTVEAWVPYFDSAPSRCLYRLVSGSVFDRIEVAPVSQTGGGDSSRFTVAGIAACTDATTPCTAEVPGASACPLPAPSAIAATPTSIAQTSATLQGTVEDNGIARGTGSGYRTNSSSYSFGASSITLISGTGTILAGNCLTIAGDANTYVVATGISAPGTIVLAPPGLRQSISAFTFPAVTLVHCTTSVAFDYGQTCSLGTSASATPGTINAGSGGTGVAANISGLSCGTWYYARVRATGRLGTTTGNYRMFRTAACGTPRPQAESHPASMVTETTATLPGIVDDNGATTSWTFEYGPTSCYGSSVPATAGTVAAGSGITAVSVVIGDPTHPTTPTPPLACNNWYHYRVVAVSAAGTTKGDDVSFRTAACP